MCGTRRHEKKLRHAEKLGLKVAGQVVEVRRGQLVLLAPQALMRRDGEAIEHKAFNAHAPVAIPPEDRQSFKHA